MPLKYLFYIYNKEIKNSNCLFGVSLVGKLSLVTSRLEVCTGPAGTWEIIFPTGQAGPGRQMRNDFSNGPGRHMMGDFSNGQDRAGTW